MSVDVLDVEYVNLDALTTEELLRERADVKVAIATIAAQLQDHTRRPGTPEDDSPAWDAYRDWRRRARWALVYRQRELLDIKAVLTERRDTGAVGHRLQRETRPTDHDLAGLERGRQMRAALQVQTDTGLLLRSYRVIRHLLNDAADLPDTLDADDRDTLSMVSIRLRNAYGTGNLRAFVNAVPGEAIVQAEGGRP